MADVIAHSFNSQEMLARASDRTLPHAPARSLLSIAISLHKEAEKARRSLATARRQAVTEADTPAAPGPAAAPALTETGAETAPAAVTGSSTGEAPSQPKKRPAPSHPPANGHWRNGQNDPERQPGRDPMAYAQRRQAHAMAGASG